MNDNTAKLLTLVHNNPDLPVICMVDDDVSEVKDETDKSGERMN